MENEFKNHKKTIDGGAITANFVYKGYGNSNSDELTINLKLEQNPILVNIYKKDEVLFGEAENSDTLELILSGNLEMYDFFNAMAEYWDSHKKNDKQ